MNPSEWTDDRGGKTPAHYGDARAEYEQLCQRAAWLEFSHGGLIAVSGPERVAFLGGLITNQVRKVGEEQTVYAAMLTPQGRFLWDFTIVSHQERLLLATEPDRVAELAQRLSMYLMRSKAQVAVLAAGEFSLLGVAGPDADAVVADLFSLPAVAAATLGATFSPDAETRLWRDPRHAAFGWRMLVPAAAADALRQRLAKALPGAGFTAWQAYRVHCCLPRGGSELIPDKTLPLEAGLEDLHGVVFDKGCYVGQETTARTKHRGTLKKRLFQVRFAEDGAPLPSGTPLLNPNGKEVGVLATVSEQAGAALAVLRLSDVAKNETLTAMAREVTVHKPEWASWN